MSAQSSAYVANAESIIEMVRLLEQDRIMTDRVSGLLPPEVAPQTLQQVVDIGCGPGGWVLEMAKTYPAMQVTGVDISEVMIAYAAQRAIAERVDTAQFRVMDFQQLAIPSSSCDFVNARFIQWFLTQQSRASILQEWFRIVRPGGILRLIEIEVALMTNSQALEGFNQWFVSALAKAGKTAVPGGRFLGTPLILRPSLQSLGCQDIHETAHLINFSAGTKEHESVSDDIVRSMETMSDFVLKSRRMQRKKLAEVQEQVRKDLQSPNFLGLMFFVAAWGRKP